MFSSEDRVRIDQRSPFSSSSSSSLLSTNAYSASSSSPSAPPGPGQGTRGARSYGVMDHWPYEAPRLHHQQEEEKEKNLAEPDWCTAYDPGSPFSGFVASQLHNFNVDAILHKFSESTKEMAAMDKRADLLRDTGVVMRDESGKMFVDRRLDALKESGDRAQTGKEFDVTVVDGMLLCTAGLCDGLNFDDQREKEALLGLNMDEPTSAAFQSRNEYYQNRLIVHGFASEDGTRQEHYTLRQINLFLTTYLCMEPMLVVSLCSDLHLVDSDVKRFEMLSGVVSARLKALDKLMRAQKAEEQPASSGQKKKKKKKQ
jgi:hypothetical protein